MAAEGIADCDNPYMYDMSGAYKKTINYGEMPLNEDTGTYIQDDYVKDDGTYAVKNKGERFKLGGLRMAKQDSIKDEDKELQKALD